MSSAALTYLKQLKYLKSKSDRAEREVADIDRRLSKSKDNAAALRRLQKDLRSWGKTYAETYNAIVNQINSLQAGSKTLLYREILSMRYIDGLTMIQIADRLGYSDSYTNSCHSRALRLFDDQFIKK